MFEIQCHLHLSCMDSPGLKRLFSLQWFLQNVGFVVLVAIVSLQMAHVAYVLSDEDPYLGDWQAVSGLKLSGCNPIVRASRGSWIFMKWYNIGDILWILYGNGIAVQSVAPTIPFHPYLVSFSFFCCFNVLLSLSITSTITLDTLTCSSHLPLLRCHSCITLSFPCTLSFTLLIC